MEEFHTSIFEKNKGKSRKRAFYTIAIYAAIGGIWVLYCIGFPFIVLKTCIPFTLVMLGIKLYDDKQAGISAYGDRKANLAIAEEYLKISDVKIPYSELTELVIYVDEYLGMPKEIYGIYHGGNNKIEFNHNGRLVSINYVIKSKEDYHSVLKLVNRIEKNPNLKSNLKKLD